MNTAKILLCAFVLATSCSAAGVGDSMRAAPAPVAEAPQVRPTAEDGPYICDFPANYCEPCSFSDPNLPPCPLEGKSGPLCCIGDVCVVWSGSHCSGDLGWCFNYTETTGPSGATQAICHDEKGGGG
jgi:hypothetical protein